MKKKIVLVFDCGATNVRAVAIKENGEIAAMHSLPNATCPDPYFPSGLIWNVDEIWQKLCSCTHAVLKKIDPEHISAITTTTFGVNGAPVDRNGKLLYPVISWQCQRTVPIMDTIDKYISMHRLFEISGVNKYSFNTINTLLWLKENRPHCIDNMEGFLFMPSLFIHKLTGQLVNDATMAGTSMLTDMKTRSFSDEILAAIGIPNRFFKTEEAGKLVGELLNKPASELGLLSGLPVVVGGHDTQLALIGSGVGENEAVLSSGTWEILMTRTRNVDLNKSIFSAGLTNELDAVPGLYNTGIQWLASGVLEWIKNLFYSKELTLTPEKVYGTMIREASETDVRHSRIKFKPDLNIEKGIISGIGIHTSRQEIYRAALEALADKTKGSLELLQQTGKFKAKSLIVAGGGSKNKLWNQIRANKLGIPVKILKQTETTVLGAALFAYVTIGTFRSIQEATDSICGNFYYVYPE